MIDSISQEILTNSFRKFGYIPSRDRRYILEIGLRMPLDDKLFFPVNPSNLGNKFDTIGNQNISIEILEFTDYRNPDNPLSQVRREMMEKGLDYREDWLWKEGLVRSYFKIM